MAKKKKATHPFMSEEDVLFYMLRTVFLSGKVSPDLLHKALGIDMQLCIDVVSDFIAQVVCIGPPEKFKEKNEN